MSDDYEAIRDALDDLASAVNERYAGYPATDRRYARDLAVVTQASAALQRLESRPTPEQSREALHTFLNAAAGEGLVLDGIDAADLYIATFPAEYAAATSSIGTGAAMGGAS